MSSATTGHSGLSGIKAVIIDLDGTMLDTAGDFHVAVNRMRHDLGKSPLDREVILQFVGKGTENLVRRVLEVDHEVSVVNDLMNTALQSYHRHYLDINGDHTNMYDGVTEGLTAMKTIGLRLACVTNKPIAFALPLLARTGLQQYFEVIYGGDSLPAKKPDPLPMLTVCRDFQLMPSQVVAIGDSSNDAAAARAAGCRVLTVPYGYNHGLPVQSIDSDGIVPTLLAAANLISA